MEVIVTRRVSEDELYHYGVKGMKWGVRRYTNDDGSLNARGIKKYAKKGYAQDSYNSNKTKLGKAYDKVTGAHKYGGDMMYNLSSNKANKARAEKYLAYEKARKEAANTPEARKARAKKAAKVGAAVAGTALAAYGAYKVSKAIKEKNFEMQRVKGLEASEKYLRENLSNHSISTFKDGTSRVTEFRGDGSRVVADYANSLGAKIHSNRIDAYNDDVKDTARSIANDYYNRGANASLKEAAKNVYDDYRQNRRRR